MKQTKRYIIFIVNLCIIHGVFTALLHAQKKPLAQLLTQTASFEAGSPVVLKFNTNLAVSLYCNGSYGGTLVHSDTDEASFKLPKFLTSKKGIIDYTLIANGESIITGSILITASKETNKTLESYIGPPSISAGGNDYTMLVVIPADIFDNPIANKTPVKIKHQFLENRTVSTEKTSDFIAWKNIYSYPTSGRLLVASSVSEIQSKEFSIEVFPAQPTNFKIDYSRKHSYADGNQITTFTTSVIKDTYNNNISDGTLIDFVIKNTKGAVLKTRGSSIRGVATAAILHPNYADTWQVTAYVSGMAVSNKITLAYEAVTNKLPVAFAEKNRKITVGPLQSFMGQLIPDGAVVKLAIFQNEKLVETKLKTTGKGSVVFELEKGFYKQGLYSFKIEALGLKVEHQNMKL